MRKIYYIFIIMLFMLFIAGCNSLNEQPIDNQATEEKQENPDNSQSSEENNNPNEESNNSNEENNNQNEEVYEELYIEEYDNKIIVGEGLYEEFYQRTHNNEKLKLVIKRTYILHPDNCSEEYYEKNKDKYPYISTVTITFDGKQYKYCPSSEYEIIYQYLIYSLSYIYHRDDLRVAVVYLLSNNKYLTFDELFYSDDPNVFSMGIEISWKINKIVTFENTNILNFDYLNNGNISFSQENQDLLFYYLDNLMWGQLSSFDSENYVPSSNVITISTTRKLIKTIIEDTTLKLNEQYNVDYVIDIDNCVVNMIFKKGEEIVYNIFADTESVKLKKLLEDLNIDFKYTEIKSAIYKYEAKFIYTAEIQKDIITFTMEFESYKEQFSGTYKVFGDQIICEFNINGENEIRTYTINNESFIFYWPYTPTWLKDTNYNISRVSLFQEQN